ncbi:MAG: hypothetical protein RLY16_2910 [Bacteroidota bacterium]
MPETPPSAIISFLDYLKFQRRYSRHTLTSYEFDLTSFFQFFQQQFDGVDPKEVTASVVRTWLASLKEAGMESRSINRKISSLKSLYKYLMRQGIVEVSPLTTIVSPKVKKRLPQFVEERDMQTLFDHVEFPEGFEGMTHRLIMELFYQTGIRQAELVGLKVTQLDLGNQQLKVLGKGNKERIIPIGAKLVAALRAYLQMRMLVLQEVEEKVLLINAKSKPFNPRQVYSIVRHYLSLVSTIDKRSPHVLRHSFATHLVNHGAELNVVKELLGHSSLAATQVYTHNTIEKLKDVYKKAHPKA